MALEQVEVMMMPVIRVSSATWERLQTHARPFEDKPEDVVNLALDALDEKLGRRKDTPKKEAKEPRSPANKGEMTPQKDFRLPLMETVLELGGAANVADIRPALEKKIGPTLHKADYGKVSSGETRWWNATCWERADLVREGLFVDDKERGVWKLSEKGRAFLRNRS